MCIDMILLMWCAWRCVGGNALLLRWLIKKDRRKGSRIWARFVAPRFIQHASLSHRENGLHNSLPLFFLFLLDHDLKQSFSSLRLLQCRGFRIAYLRARLGL